jgi:hypothetical protein
MAQRITNQTIHNPQMLRKVLEAMDTEIDAVRTLINELRTDMSEHIHGGVTTGGGNTSAGPTIAGAAVTEQVEDGT